MKGQLNGRAANISIKCNTENENCSIQRTIDDIGDISNIPDMTECGFKIFDQVDGQIYAIHVNSESTLILKNASISNFKGLGTVFLVENTKLDIRSGVIRDILDSHNAGAMSISKSNVRIRDCHFTNTNGNQSGVASVVESTVLFRKSRFEDNCGTGESLVFYAEASRLNLRDSSVIGTLFHSDQNYSNTLDIQPIWENFKVVEAQAGAFYLTNASTLRIRSSQLMHFTAMKGLIYLENNSVLVCDNGSFVHNIAINGGAIFAQNSKVKVKNAYFERNGASRGGAILFRGSSTGRLQSTTFTGNLASEGGAFYLEMEDCENLKHQYIMSITGCSFINNRAYYYGGAVFTSCASLNITNGKFTDNVAALEGGGIYVNASVNLNLKNVQFSKNNAREGGAVTVNAKRTHGNMAVERGKFNGNEAVHGSGGAILYQGNHSSLTMSSNEFRNNRAAKNGGALCSFSTIKLDITADQFRNNTARDGSGGAIHAINNTALVLSFCTIETGWANDSGGGAFIQRTESVIVRSCYISQNRAEEGDGGGFAFWAVGNITVESTRVIGNVAGSSGGGISYRMPLFISDSERNITIPSVELTRSALADNEAYYGGGILLHCIKSLEVTNSFIERNKAIKDGGGIRAANVSSINFSQSGMNQNLAVEGSGGAMFINKSQDLTILLSVFINNIGSSYGGAVYLLETPLVSVHRSQFYDNKVTDDSGGALALFNGRKIIIENTDFERNQANRSGGAIYMDQHNETEISLSNFRSNVAMSEDGGGIYFLSFHKNHSHSDNGFSKHEQRVDENIDQSTEDNPKDIIMTETVFVGNEAGRHGGGIYLDNLDGTFTMKNVPTFERCKAIRGSGGCAYISNITALDIRSGKIVNNTAYLDGGCYFLMNIPQVDLNESNFRSCGTCKGRGGAIFYHGDSKMENTRLATPATLINNNAAEGGACYISNVELLLMEGSYFYENKAHDGSGGSMVAKNISYVSLTNIRMIVSEASESCGGLCISHVQVLDLSGTFSSNVAKSSNGGAVWLSDVLNVVIYGTFDHNKADGFGGALFITNTVEAIVFSTNFRNNVAIKDGGAVSVHSVNSFEICDTTLTHNEARYGGGLHIGNLHQETEQLFGILVKTCIFSLNKARIDGGGGVVINDLSLPVLNSKTPEIPSHLIVNFTNCSFEYNNARNGGGLGVFAGTVRVNDADFFKNDASRSGGALYLDDESFFAINDTIMERNTANKGGAILVTCESNANITYSLIRRNTAPRRDDGGVVACERANLFMMNVTFVHNFEDYKWYFYVIFPVCSYAVLFVFLIIGASLLQRISKRRKHTVTYDTYSAIGEYDPAAEDLSAFFAEPAQEMESDDEGIIAPKPSPSDPEAKSEHLVSSTVARENDPEISEEDSEESLPIAQHPYPPRL
eukprot:g7104.t1